jgi:hypothetical protein
MNNQELYLKFIEIASCNPFDAYCKLKDFKKEYKKSDFYKATHLPLNKAYEYASKTIFVQLYTKIQEITDVSSWVAKINYFIEDLDEDTIQSLIDKISSHFNLNSLDFEKGELRNFLDEMKSLK